MAEVSLAAARALLSRVNTLEDETSPENILVTLRDDPDWLVLPLAKREAALKRFKVLRAYDRKKKPTKKQAADAAAELGIQLRSFYAMLRSWRDKGKTPFALVPYRGEEDAPRPSRLDPAVAKHLIEQVRTLLKEKPSLPPGEAVRDIAAGWPQTLGRPSAVTVRSYLERERAAVPAEPGTLSLAIGATGHEDVEAATRFGEVIVVDHTSPARLLIDGETAIAPTITLAIDLFSGMPVGAAVSEDEPGPEAVLDALADAHERMAALGEDGPIAPRILYASTPDLEWTMLREQLQADGFDVGEWRDHRLQYGGPIKRLIGSKLGSIALHPSKAGRASGNSIDPDQDALLTMNQMLFVVDAVLERIIEERLPMLPGSGAARLGLPVWLMSRGSLKARTRPLIQLDIDRSGPSLDDDMTSDIVELTTGRDGELLDPEFEVELRDIVADIVGRQLTGVEVHAPTPSAPGWLVQVSIRNMRHLPEAWLRLAREAIEIAETDGEMVRFEVVVAPSPEPALSTETRTGPEHENYGDRSLQNMHR